MGWWGTLQIISCYKKDFPSQYKLHPIIRKIPLHNIVLSSMCRPISALPMISGTCDLFHVLWNVNMWVSRFSFSIMFLPCFLPGCNVGFLHDWNWISTYSFGELCHVPNGNLFRETIRFKFEVSRDVVLLVKKIIVFVHKTLPDSTP